MPTNVEKVMRRCKFKDRATPSPSAANRILELITTVDIAEEPIAESSIGIELHRDTHESNVAENPSADKTRYWCYHRH